MAHESKNIRFENRKARFDYFFIDKYVAGLVLKGSEIKAIREGKVSFNDAYVFVKDGELYVKNLYIGEYSNASYSTHAPLRERKLLLNKSEIRKIIRDTQSKGITIVPVSLFINNRGFAKLDIAVAKGKKSHDKRESIKKADLERQMGRKF
ncbi:MAG: SsrA-binding protein SmpB [Bacteroidia bacterium]|nr:SsrA-binding protein SmpB [Bacteroidia bacterium]